MVRAKCRPGDRARFEAGFGWRVRRPGRAALAAALACAAGLAGLPILGCATVDPDRQAAEREAAVARWERCVERHTSADGSWLEAVEAARRHCDGHRRDVAHTFAPHMEARVRHRLAARERADALRARTARRAEATPRLDRLLLRMTDERGNL